MQRGGGRRKGGGRHVRRNESTTDYSCFSLFKEEEYCLYEHIL